MGESTQLFRIKCFINLIRNAPTLFLDKNVKKLAQFLSTQLPFVYITPEAIGVARYHFSFTE